MDRLIAEERSHPYRTQGILTQAVWVLQWHCASYLEGKWVRIDYAIAKYAIISCAAFVDYLLLYALSRGDTIREATLEKFDSVKTREIPPLFDPLPTLVYATAAPWAAGAAVALAVTPSERFSQA